MSPNQTSQKTTSIKPLSELESIIQKGLESFIEVGQALQKIKEEVNNDVTNTLKELEEFHDIIGRNWHDPEDGLGYDNSPSAHMWRSMIFPNNSL